MIKAVLILALAYLIAKNTSVIPKRDIKEAKVRYETESYLESREMDSLYYEGLKEARKEQISKLLNPFQ